MDCVSFFFFFCETWKFLFVIFETRRPHSGYQISLPNVFFEPPLTTGTWKK